jgi:hypothetical protein
MASSMDEVILGLMAARRPQPLAPEDEQPEDTAAPDFSSGVRRPLPREVPQSARMNMLILERWRGPTMLGRRT